jgi:hypothetical protein
LWLAERPDRQPDLHAAIQPHLDRRVNCSAMQIPRAPHSAELNLNKKTTSTGCDFDELLQKAHNLGVVPFASPAPPHKHVLRYATGAVEGPG